MHDLGLRTVEARSSAQSRDTYLRRPDLGRELSPSSRQELTEIANRERASGRRADVVIVIADGLSSKAVSQNAAKFVTALLPHASKAEWKFAPVVLADQARVAFGDEVGEIFQAALVVVLIGERPGLSSPDSLGVYLTWEPRKGRKDAERNCISNVRQGGLPYDEAAFKLAWLMREAFRRKITGVNLKDESNYQIESTAGTKQIG
jgi:ethanolamine ammonia-lyase small subunit